MPTYVYEREDGSRFELDQRISEDALIICPETGQKVRRVIHAGAFQLKGSGWYKTDYTGSSAKSGDNSAASESKSGKTDSESGKSEATTTKGHSCGGGGCGCK